MTPSPKPTRVLFVEDAFDQALLVKTFFSAEGYEVVHAQDGDHAVRLLKEEAFDLLVTDLNLPGTDGFMVIRAARQHQDNIPILATTGYTASAYQEQAFRAGATDLLTKPLDRDDFLAKVRSLVGARPTPQSVGAVLAVGGLVGDVEMGCGATLLSHRSNGREVLILPLCGDDGDPEGLGLEGARRAAEILGATVILDRGAMEHTTGRVALLDSVIQEHAPDTAYIPAMDESHPARMEAFRVAKAATASVKEVFGYQTATTGHEFRPERSVEVGDHMVMKMEALAAYQASGAGRLDLMPRMAQAYARYWSRLHGFAEVEVFEVIREG